GGVGGPGVAHEDVGDAGGHHQASRGREEHGGVGEGLPPLGLPEPQRRVAQLIYLRRRFLGLRGWHRVQVGAPEPDLSSQDRWFGVGFARDRRTSVAPSSWALTYHSLSFRMYTCRVGLPSRPRHREGRGEPLV